MSENYVKKYDVGEIKLDLPYANYIHELPLLSFGDVLHTINLGLVYNHKTKKDNVDYSYIAPGFRINLQKQIDFENNIPKFLQDDSGLCIPLKYCNGGALYTFEDDSKRILRKSGSTYVLENPDQSKEYYDETGKITSKVDKYGEFILLYSYNSENQLTSITYRGTKAIQFVYDSNKLHSITYADKTTTINYIGHHITVAHYSGVDFNYSTTNDTFSIYSANAGEGSSDPCSRRWMCTNNLNSLTVNQISGGETIDTNTYNFWDYSEETKECHFVDVTDKFGVTSRIQLENRTPAYSYELKDNFFDGEAMGDLIYSGTVFSYNNKDAMGPQPQSGGFPLTKIENHYWTFGFSDTTRISGRVILSGWINVAGNSDCIFSITKTGIPAQEYCVTHSVPIIKEQTWQYFSFSFTVNNMNALTVGTNINNPSIYSKDLRLTFQSGTLSNNSSLYSLSIEDVYINEKYNGVDDKIFMADKCKFFVGNTELIGKVTCEDMLKYKINQLYGNHPNEIYYNDCKNVIVDSNNFYMNYTEDGIAYTIPVSDLIIGKRIFTRGIEYIVKNKYSTTVTEDGSLHLIAKSFFKDKLNKEEVYNEHRDLISSTVDGVTTSYVRNIKGLVERQEIRAEGTTETITTSTVYNDNCTKILSTTDEFGVITSYETDDTWGLVTEAKVNGNTIVRNEFDDYKAALIKCSFANGDDSRNNMLGYTNGRLGSMKQDNLEYIFGYTPNGKISSVAKNDINNEIETHMYEEEEDESSITSDYNTHSEVQEFDKYGRLTDIVGLLNNTYSVSATFNDEEEIENYIDRYQTSTTDDITGKLAVTHDQITNKSIKYAYEFGRLFKKGVFDAENLESEETFTYDTTGRITKDDFVYNQLSKDSVQSVIEYEKEATDPTADNRVNRYSYYLNGATSPIAQTGYYFDDFHRVKSKFHSINGKEFTKNITYDKTRPRQLLEMINGRPILNANYTYDAMGRIASVSEGGYTTSYTYDAYGQLIGENNQGLDKTFQYVYNGIGNIESVTSGENTINFGYTDTAHPDRLTSYNNKAITYNANGGVASYNGWNYIWNNKGKLASITTNSNARALKPILSSSKTYSFTYNALGQRTTSNYTYFWVDNGLTPIVQGEVTNYSKTFYYDHSGRLISETISKTLHGVGNESESIVFLYDESSIIGMVRTASGVTNAYYFQRNLLGDVIAIYDTNGNKVVEYAYDAWGNCTIKGTTTNYVVAHANPIRYRGYYYDENTKLYYLNARYYSPELRRFISPANVSTLNPDTVNGLDLYLYAENNPMGVTYSGLNSIVNAIDDGKTSSTGSVRNSVGTITSDNRAFGSINNAYINWPKTNAVSMVHYTTSLIKNPMISWMLGNISYTTTVQLNHANPLYWFTNTGNDGYSLGVGVNLGNWYSTSAYVSNNMGFGFSWQLTPWVTGSLGWSLENGLSIGTGVIIGNMTHEITLSIGNGAIAGYAICGLLSTLPMPGARAVAATVASVIFLINIFS